jgi:hypothetical protein
MPSGPTLQKALSFSYIWETGDVVLRAYLDLEVCDAQGGWHPAKFRVDSGADMTMVPAAWAKGLGLSLGLGPVQVTQTTADGSRQTVTVRSGLLRARVPGLDPTIYFFPCYFVGNPDAAPAPAGAVPRNLLGLTGVVDKLRITFDGSPCPGALHGTFTVEKL